jgi:hypothetical protein
MIGRFISVALMGAFALAGLLFVSGTALAHQGHSHQVVHTHATANAVQPGVSQAPPQSVSPSETVVFDLVATQTDDQTDSPANTCNGACCAASFSCCGSAMAPLPLSLGPPHLRGHAIAIRAGPIGPGINPEALPKPPKSFA